MRKSSEKNETSNTFDATNFLLSLAFGKLLPSSFMTRLTRQYESQILQLHFSHDQNFSEITIVNLSYNFSLIEIDRKTRKSDFVRL